MTIASATYTVGSASVELCAPSAEPQRVTVQNLQPATADEAARDGYVFVAADRFSIANNGTAHLQITTPSTGAQFQFYEIVASSSDISAELIEGATFGSATAVTGYNLNRDSARTPSSTLSAATAVSGGTVISEEYIPASNQAGGSFSFSKVHTLPADSSYVMRFTDVGGNGAVAFLQLGWAEQYNGGHDVYLNNTAGSAFRIRAGETWEGLLYAGEGLYGSTTGQECQVGVFRQDQA